MQLLFICFIWFLFLFTCNLSVASVGYNPWYVTLLKQNKVPPGTKWIHFLQINLIDEYFTQWESQVCRWLVFFCLELQGTDGKAAALIYLNGSTGPYLFFVFSSDFFFPVSVPCWITTAETCQKLFLSFLFCAFFPTFDPTFLVMINYKFQSQNSRTVLSCFAKQWLYMEMLRGLQGTGRAEPSQPLFRCWGVGGDKPTESSSAYLFFLISISCCHCWRERTGLDWPLNWWYRAFFMVLCSEN